MIDVVELERIMPRLRPEDAERFVDPLNRALDEFAINTWIREACFLGQIAHESGELRHWEENLNYSATALVKCWPNRFTPDKAQQYARQPEKIANHVYADRLGNGSEASGDGWRYRGRGPIQLTGRDNYQRAGKALGVDLVAEPDQVAEPEVGFRVAGWFWVTRGLNELADKGDYRTITRRINGGMNGWDDRLGYYARAKVILSRDDLPYSEPSELREWYDQQLHDALKAMYAGATTCPSASLRDCLRGHLNRLNLDLKLAGAKE